MKQLWIRAFALALCLALAGCARGGEDMIKEDTINREDMPGGFVDRTNPDAPKVIVSKELTSFEFEFNCDFFARYSSVLDYDVCRFSLAREDEGARCIGSGYGRSGGFDIEFVAELSALDALQAIVEKYDLAQYNGENRHVNGLPAHLGDWLHVKYASGESIFAANNQSPIVWNADARFAIFYFFSDLADEADSGFYTEEAEAFQYRVRGQWVDHTGRYTLELYDDAIKLYDGETLIDDTTYTFMDGKLSNTRTEDGSYTLFTWVEWSGGWLNGRREDSGEHQFRRVYEDLYKNVKEDEPPITWAVEENSMANSQTFVFSSLPQDAEELWNLPEATFETPYQTAALTVAALCRYGDDPQAAIDMLDYLKGPQALTPYEQQFLKDRLSGKAYKPFSFFEGATPENDYTPSQPYTITVFDGPYSFQKKGYAKLMIRSSGADNPREIKLRQKADSGAWYLWEIYLLSDIRQPKSADPWG